jgi:hypothetical protein
MEEDRLDDRCHFFQYGTRHGVLALQNGVKDLTFYMVYFSQASGGIHDERRNNLLDYHRIITHLT